MISFSKFGISHASPTKSGLHGKYFVSLRAGKRGEATSQGLRGKQDFKQVCLKGTDSLVGLCSTHLHQKIKGVCTQRGLTPSICLCSIQLFIETFFLWVKGCEAAKNNSVNLVKAAVRQNSVNSVKNPKLSNFKFVSYFVFRISNLEFSYL